MFNNGQSKNIFNFEIHFPTGSFFNVAKAQTFYVSKWKWLIFNLQLGKCTIANFKNYSQVIFVVPIAKMKTSETVYYDKIMF
jgi:hypothetical protein